MGRTSVYVAEIKDKTMFGEPMFETERVEWMTLDQFIADGRQLHVHVVKECVTYIMNL
jgi:hypothetical protein